MQEKEFEEHVEKEVVKHLDAIVEDDGGVVRHYMAFVSQLQKTIETKDTEIVSLKSEIVELKEQHAMAVGQQQTVRLNTAMCS